MRILHANLWDLHQGPTQPWAVIPTNMGWRDNGTAVMGAGLAYQAAQRYPVLETVYGDFLRTGYRSGRLLPSHPVGGVLPYPEGRLFLLPTKGLNPDCPRLSWKSPSSVDFVISSLVVLGGYVESDPAREWIIPLLGAGKGELDPTTVLCILAGFFHRFPLVTIVAPPFVQIPPQLLQYCTPQT